MSKENKIAKVPVASHGLHRHPYNYPWLSSINFGDVMPCYINTVRKGERDEPKAGVYSQLMPIAHNAFATGRFNFKAIFVPYKLVWRPWYSFDQQTEFVSNGATSTPGRYPYVQHGTLSEVFVTNYCTTQGATSTNYDIVLHTAGSNGTRYLVSEPGRRVLRILGALGCMPSFISKDSETMNILPIMCYLKAFADYYFPNNYVGNIDWLKLVKWFDRDTIAFTASSDSEDLLYALEVASVNFYENSIFDLAWDNPASPNTYSTTPAVSIPDVTAEESSVAADMTVDNTISQNGTPMVQNEGNAITAFSQYILNALKSVSMWAKRRQLSGARLLDRFLVSRGITLGNDSARISFLVGQRNIEIEVSGVENNTDTNLGELAGRGIASSGNSPLSFSCKPDDDGIFLVLVSPLPDANFPVLLDGFACRKDYLDNYTAEYDKLGSAAVPSRVIVQGLNGVVNNLLQNTVWGFLSQYWDEVQERPRLLGDFLLKSRGAEELQAYHTFRIFNPQNPDQFAYHSYANQRMKDKSQYQRLFYSADQENLMLFLRWYGDQYKEKLPLGDSYEWDDDEMNRKVNLVVGGSQK